MICCCSHVVQVHAPPAAEGEGPGKCAKPGCECGLFEVDPTKTQYDSTEDFRRPVAGGCGCVDIGFADGRMAQLQCEEHTFFRIAKSFEAILNTLGPIVVAFQRLAEIRHVEYVARRAAEDAELLRRPPPGPRLSR